MKTYQYIKSPEILKLCSNFIAYLEGHGIVNFNDSKHKNLRNLMIDYFKTKQFLDDYFLMAEVIAKNLGLNQPNMLLQKIPTPRIFRPSDHGTSFHSDYWYGHGEKTLTVWTPLSDLVHGNSFSIIPSQELNNEVTVELGKSYGVATKDQEKNLINISDQVLMSFGESVIFPSKIIHGSPKNSTNYTRVSFDFRIANVADATSTKDSESYFRYLNGFFVETESRFAGLNFIKYICGGAHKNTLAQHLIIESVVKEYKISILGQEAEVERFGYPIFNAYLENLANNKNINGLIIASKAVLDLASIEAAKKCKSIKIYCALEGEFI